MYVQAINTKNTKGWVAEIKERGFYKYRIISKGDGTGIFDKNGFYSHKTISATEKQIVHLKACIVANKYIPYIEIFNPEIY